MTNPQERQTREGFEDQVPRTPDEFEKYWLNSQAYRTCIGEADAATDNYAGGDEKLGAFRSHHKQMQAHHTRAKSPYIISVPMQVRLCITRAYQRIWNDKASTM